MKIFLIIFLISISSLSLVNSRHRVFVVYTETQKVLNEHNQIKEDITLYESTLSELKDHARIESIAKNDLKMKEIETDDIYDFNLENKD